ncbi:hypothetical protein ABTX81_30735 [Kitasatospora sp. NPDC097605]|uniref:hypothetical protein n=1 Tax=Kitasatospora sp. NPDC097605 TaxID=3157226 RepID=UPI00332FA818
MTVEQDSTIHIDATEDSETGRPECIVAWGGWAGTFPLEKIRSTAEALFAAAAAAECDAALIAELRAGLQLPDEVIGVMLGKVRERRPLPAGTFLRIEAGVSASTGLPFVKVRQGSNAGQLSPDEAKAMGRQWLASAEAAEHDAITRYVLRDSGRNPVEVEDFFRAMAALRRG